VSSVVMSHELMHPRWLAHLSIRIELDRVGLDIHDRRAVNGIKSLHGQFQTIHIQQGAARNPEVIWPDRRVTCEDADEWPLRVPSRVGRTAVDPGVLVKVEDDLDVRELGQAKRGVGIYNCRVQDQL